MCSTVFTRQTKLCVTFLWINFREQKILKVQQALHLPNEMVCDFSCESASFWEIKYFACDAHSSLIQGNYVWLFLWITFREAKDFASAAQSSPAEGNCVWLFFESTTFRERKCVACAAQSSLAKWNCMWLF